MYSEDLHHMDNVSSTLKKQILEGKYVNLASLFTSRFLLPEEEKKTFFRRTHSRIARDKLPETIG